MLLYKNHCLSSYKVTYSTLHRRLNRYINDTMSLCQHPKPSYRFHVRVIGCIYTHKHLHTSCISPGLLDLIGYHFYCIWSSSICNPLYPHLTSSSRYNIYSLTYMQNNYRSILAGVSWMDSTREIVKQCWLKISKLQTLFHINNNSSNYPSAHLTYTRIYYYSIVAKTTSLKKDCIYIW